MKTVSILLFLAAITSAAPGASRPLFEAETLRYSLNWPSGLSLGEAQLTSSRQASDGSYSFSLTGEATFPGVPLALSVKSQTSSQFCSTSLEKFVKVGPKRTNEKTSFDQTAHTAQRETEKGGKSDLNIPACGKDALAFLYFARQELIQGRTPQTQTVYYGAGYQVRMDFKGVQTVPAGGANVETEHMIAHIKGPVTEADVDFFFARDAARTPVLIRIPVSIGTFSLEIVR